MDYQRCPGGRKERMRVHVRPECHVADDQVHPCGAVVGGDDGRQVAEMRPLGVLEPVLPARRVEVAAGRRESRRITSADDVDVERVAPWREIREPQGDSYAGGGV